jgi:hypothetical protein
MISSTPQAPRHRKRTLAGKTRRKTWCHRGEPSPRLASAARELSHDRLMAAVTSGTTSPERSEDSYDLVSSGHASATGDASAAHPHVKEASDDDSDEDDEDEDDEDEDDEDSAESDWE